MNPICKILGHKYDLDLNFHGPWNCTRCDHVCDPYSEEEYDSKSLDLGGKWWRLKKYAAYYFSRSFRWFLKCHDCGKRWGKHDDSCPPF